MKKLKAFFDFDTEEAWLNQMAQDGHLLTTKRLYYRFRSIEPGSAVIRVDYRDRRMSPSDFSDYRVLFEDSGWHHLDGSRAGGPQYFASFGADADADIFSDAESKAARYRRSIAYRGAAALPLLVIVFVLWTQGTLIPPPARWYLTPGLWDRQGAEFLTGFLFETPFALMRVGVPLLLVAACLILLVQLAQQYRLYRRATRS